MSESGIGIGSCGRLRAGGTTFLAICWWRNDHRRVAFAGARRGPDCCFCRESDGRCRNHDRDWPTLERKGCRGLISFNPQPEAQAPCFVRFTPANQMMGGWWTNLSEDRLDDFAVDVRQAKISTLESIDESFVVDTEQMQDGGV